MRDELDNTRLTVGLAACLHMVRIHVRSRTTVEKNDLYWETRESCAAVARGLCLSWPEVVSAERALWMEEDGRYEDLSSPFWDMVIPRQLILERIMES